MGALNEEIVLKVKESAQSSSGSIRYQIEEPVSQAVPILKGVKVCKGDSCELVRSIRSTLGRIGPNMVPVMDGCRFS